jgi:type III pantothenate kinase
VANQYFHQAPMVIGPGIKTGMPILYDNPHEVGADRIVNAVAAFNRYNKSLIIVDFGTATTFDVVTEKGEYQGGVIAPGITISMDALFIHTSKLPRVELKMPKTVIGKNTVNSIQSGILHGYIGLVDGIVEKIIDEMPEKPVVLATGGLAPVIAPHTRTIESIEENLTIEGLQLIWEMNHKQKS